MTNKQKFWSAYFTIALLFATYGSIWGAYHYKGFFYNLGRALIWPTIIFPALGNVLGVIILLVVLVAVLTLVRS